MEVVKCRGQYFAGQQIFINKYRPYLGETVYDQGGQPNSTPQQTASWDFIFELKYFAELLEGYQDTIFGQHIKYK